MHTKDKIIRQFGITSKYKGYRYLLDAIHIAAENYDECLKVTKDVYPVIAHKYGVTKVSVERDIRTVIEKCWDNNKHICRSCPATSFPDAPQTANL